MSLPEPPAAGTAMLPPGTYSGTVVLITGAGTGLGKGMVVEFGRLGASVVVAGRRAEKRADGVEAVEKAGGRAVGVNLDVRDPEQVAAAFDEAERAFGPVGVLVNNAAGNFPGCSRRAITPEALRASRTAGAEVGASTVPVGRTGRLHGLGWAATYLCSPFVAYLTGRTLVLDGANWLRRGLRMPEFVPVREQPGLRRDDTPGD